MVHANFSSFLVTDGTLVKHRKNSGRNNGGKSAMEMDQRFFPEKKASFHLSKLGFPPLMVISLS